MNVTAHIPTRWMTVSQEECAARFILCSQASSHSINGEEAEGRLSVKVKKKKKKKSSSTKSRRSVSDSCFSKSAHDKPLFLSFKCHLRKC